MVDGRDHKSVGDRLFARPLKWRLAVQVVAIESSAAFRKALRRWLSCTAVAVDYFHLISLANQAVTETRQHLSQQVKGRRGRAIDKAWAHRLLLLTGGDTLCCRAALRLQEVFTPSTIQPAPFRPSGESRNSSGSCSALAPWTLPQRPRTYSRNWSRRPRARKPTGSTAPSADGGKRRFDLEQD
ncbi:hypothetical protein DXK94_13220 [Arthrobacter sp. RT-1]|uniref:transposase n=1 Tax=Arthrobacter sp. RT-1 TaxID=2292263 RepID=UPI000E1EC11C|nr:hypothetical protein DXK94_13220 [Arthrobacter sp. RT-1]